MGTVLQAPPCPSCGGVLHLRMVDWHHYTDPADGRAVLENPSADPEGSSLQCDNCGREVDDALAEEPWTSVMRSAMAELNRRRHAADCADLLTRLVGVRHGSGADRVAPGDGVADAAGLGELRVTAGRLAMDLLADLWLAVLHADG